MRKTLSLLIVLTMAIAGFSFLCHCCPAYAREVSQIPVISSPECTCCSDTIEVSKNDLATRSNQEFFISSLTRLLTLSFVVVKSVVEPNKPSTHAIDSSPPARSSETPLYLALEVLRL